MATEARAGDPFPDLDVADNDGNGRRLSDLVGGDPSLVQLLRGRATGPAIARHGSGNALPCGRFAGGAG